jgi:hypothetical protein
MWLATKFGFYSIVQKQAPKDGKPAVFHVRARVRKDLENLITATALQKEIQEWKNADYRYRIIVGQQEVTEIMAHLAESLDYDNFKSMIGNTPDQRAKLHGYHEIWGVMMDLQK